MATSASYNLCLGSGDTSFDGMHQWFLTTVPFVQGLLKFGVFILCSITFILFLINMEKEKKKTRILVFALCMNFDYS
jgi:hypothetical protein